jgi:hypothetical protein
MICIIDRILQRKHELITELGQGKVKIIAAITKKYHLPNPIEAQVPIITKILTSSFMVGSPGH